MYLQYHHKSVPPLEIFIEGEGYDIRFEPEIPEKKATRQEPPAPDNKPDDEGFADDEDDDL
jgi:hypothetical protein